MKNLREALVKYSNGSIDDSYDWSMIGLRGIKTVQDAQDKLVRMERSNVHITEEVLNQTKELLSENGCKWIVSCQETDQLLSALFHKGVVNGAITIDTDVLAYGIENFIFNYSVDGTAQLIRYSKVLEMLGLTKQQFLDFIVLCSTDYNSNIPQIGCVRALKLIKEYLTIEEIQKQINKSPSNYQRTRQIFTELSPEMEQQALSLANAFLKQ